MKTLKQTERKLVIQNSIVPVNQGKAIAVIDNETATPVYYCLINSNISKEQAKANAKIIIKAMRREVSKEKNNETLVTFPRFQCKKCKKVFKGNSFKYVPFPLNFAKDKGLICDDCKDTETTE